MVTSMHGVDTVCMSPEPHVDTEPGAMCTACTQLQIVPDRAELLTHPQLLCSTSFSCDIDTHFLRAFITPMAM